MRRTRSVGDDEVSFKEGGEMKRRIVTVAAVVAALVAATVAFAVTNGVPDGNNHPYVGLMVAQDAGGNPLWRCSGTLVSSTVFLTAGHCTAADEGGDVAHAEIWFDKGPILTDSHYTSKAAGGTGCDNPAVTGYPCHGDAGGTPHTNPLYKSPDNPYGGGNGLPAFSYRDVGVVKLSAAHTMSTYGALPTAGQIDTLKSKTAVDFVGYGVSRQVMAYPGQSPYDRWTGPKERLFAPSELVSGNFVNSAEYMRLALNPGGGSGGTCFGDSGGPDLLGGTNTVLSVNSYVTNSNCRGVGYSARVDIPAVLTWINSF